MVSLGGCSKGIIPLVILDEGTADHSCYIKNVFPVALKYGNEVFDDNWAFQQDSANPHRDHLIEEGGNNNFPSFIDKDRRSPNSPDLNPRGYFIWDELVNVIEWNKVR